MNVACPSCESIYRIDPASVPGDGVRARCRQCQAVFLVEPAPGQAAGEVATGGAVAGGTGDGDPGEAPDAGAEAAPAVAGPVAAEPAGRGGGAERPARPAFGPQDPEVRAKRLARALVSDIVVYNRDKWERTRESGSLRQEFRDEILKSWEEYVEQVGAEKAKRTPYFRDALNDILAQGKHVF